MHFLNKKFTISILYIRTEGGVLCRVKTCAKKILVFSCESWWVSREKKHKIIGGGFKQNTHCNGGLVQGSS